MLSLLNNQIVRRVLGPTAAGTTTVTSDWVDMAGKQTCLFVTAFGTLTSGNVNTLTIEGSDDASTAVALDSDAVLVYDTEDNKLCRIEIVKPTHRYVRLKIARATANAVIDIVIAIIGVTLRNLPISLDSTCTHYGEDSFVSPDPA